MVWGSFRTSIRQGLIIGTCVVLSACSLTNKGAGPPLLNGKWNSADGVYVAELLNGSFTAVANDTGSIISQGEYIALAEDKVKLEWTSAITGLQNKAECEKPEPDTLNCVDQQGNRFSLQRISQTS